MTSSALRHSSAVPNLSERQLQVLSKLIQDHSGLSFPENRRSELERGVRQAFAGTPCYSMDEYVRLLQNPTSGAHHLEQLVNTLTIGETHFFRNAGHFNALSQHVLPALIARRRALRTLRIWSAGCASGEEPYSLAITLRELLPNIDEWTVTILATDINTSTLNRARAGLYSDWSFREERARRLRSLYFSQQGNRYQLHANIRKMVTFAPLNLAQGNYPDLQTNTVNMDLIVCRNVMIYFSAESMREMIGRFHSALSDGGWLVVGHSENSIELFSQFESCNFPGATFYQRIDGRAPEHAVPVPVMSTPVAWRPPSVLPVVPSPEPPAKIVTPRRPNVPPDPSPEGPPLERARDLLFFGHPELARDLLLASADHADLPPAELHLLLGQAYANLGDWVNAETQCRRASELNRLSAETYYILALVLQHQGRISEAIHALKTVVYIDRRHVLGHFGLSELHGRNGQPDHAAKSLRNVTRLLAGLDDGDPAPGCPEVTVGRLRQAVESLQRR